MNSTQLAAFVCYAIAALIAFIFGTTYLTRKEFMPYHADAVEMEWGEVDKRFQVLILALLRAVGGGWLAVGITFVFLLAFPFREQASWALFALPLVGLAVCGPTLYATLYVRNNTQAAPPLPFVVVAVVLLVAGFVLSIV